MEKLDFKKALKEFYSAKPDDFRIVKVPPLQFLMADGCGDPNTAERFGQCVEALYTVAYTVKFNCKKCSLADFVVPPLEGLWWVGEQPGGFETAPRDAWQWTLMIALPDTITDGMVQQAVAQAREKKDLPALGTLRLECYEEGLAVQTMHVGPYSAERETIQRMHAFIHGKGHHLRGRHHEVYMSDPRRVPPEKLKTILRHPIM